MLARAGEDVEDVFWSLGAGRKRGAGEVAGDNGGGEEGGFVASVLTRTGERG